MKVSRCLWVTSFGRSDCASASNPPSISSRFEGLNMAVRRGIQRLMFLFCAVIATAWCSASASDDYFSRITMASDGRITRFSHEPISVHIEAPPVPAELQDAYVGNAKYALDQWARCSEEKLRFELSDSENADIRISWTDEPLVGEGDPLGEASLVRFDSGDFHVEMAILLQDGPSLKASVHRELKVVLLHELGHAIGLWGHSQDPNDIMHRGSIAIYPTRRDKNTLLKLLSTPDNSPFHENAIAELESDVSKDPDATHLHFWLGTVYADIGEGNLAVKELLAALKLSPNLMKASHRLGRIFQEEGMYSRAIAYYSREAELESSPGLYAAIGMLHFRQEKYDRAVDYFEKALSMDSSFLAARTDALAAYHLWASLLIKGNQADEAISVLLRALRLFPSSRVIYYDLGTAYDASLQYERAIEQYKKALEIDPTFTHAKRDIASCTNNLGAERMKNRDWTNSIELCKEALEWDPDCWEASKNLESATLGLGREKRESGLLDEAIPLYEAVLNMNAENLDAYVGLGFAFFEKGMYKNALAQFQTVLDIDADFQDAKEGVAVVKQQTSISRAKVAILLTSISLLLCTLIALLFRQLHRRKT